MKFLAIALACFALAVVIAVGSPAAAIDCARAVGVVETAICGDQALRKSDARFNRNYARLVDLVDQEQRRELIESQRLWLAERDALCRIKPPAEIVACVSKAMERRADELANSYSDGYVYGFVRIVKAGQRIPVGQERLDIVSSNNDESTLQLVHGNTLIAESLSFEVEGRAGDESGEAVVVATHDGGSLGCSDQYLVSAQPHRPLRVETLNVPGSCSKSLSVVKKGRGLEFTTPAEPGVDGLSMRWSAESGLVRELSSVFSPRHGTRMTNFDSSEPPTDNEEFYTSLKSLAPRDWRSMAQALQFAYVRSDDADKYIVMAPCSGIRGCPTDNAFAAYAREKKMFYFAYAVPGLRKVGDRGETGIIFYPDHAVWPADLLHIVGDWEKGEMSEKPY